MVLAHLQIRQMEQMAQRNGTIHCKVLQQAGIVTRILLQDGSQLTLYPAIQSHITAGLMVPSLLPRTEDSHFPAGHSLRWRYSRNCYCLYCRARHRSLSSITSLRSSSNLVQTFTNGAAVPGIASVPSPIYWVQ